jgi:phenylacetate-coenzyme A ligase PaaK-like adenylate-forming protein
MYDKKIYKYSPQLLQNMMISARSYLINKVTDNSLYQDHLKEVNRTQWLSQQALRDYQNEKLDRLHCVLKATKFYSLMLEAINELTTDTISQLPGINKETICAHPADFLNPHFSGAKISGTTSGTTGLPLALHKSLDELRWERAFISRQLQWAGYIPGKKRVWLRGDMIVSSASRSPPFWRTNYIDNMMMMSSFHLSAKNAVSYIQALERFDPYLIQAFPSSIVFLATYLEQTDQYYAGDGLSAILTSSETLSPEKRALVKKRFGCKVFDWYGSYERVAAIGTCEYEKYHLIQDYSVAELLPSQGGRHEIVGTSFNNMLMPLVRYQTGDYVEVCMDSTCACGRSFPVINQIFGRDDDSIITPSGGSVRALALVFKDTTGILLAQVVQNCPDSVQILLVPADNYQPKHSAQIVQKFRDRVGGELHVEVKLVDSIARTGRGKLKVVVCNIKH